MNPSQNTGKPEAKPGIEALVCFAVREEARHFKPLPAWRCRTVVTGIGQTNATKAIIAALESSSPKFVLTCGYAGGLNPKLKCGDVVFETDLASMLNLPLIDSGAVAGRFHCAKHIAVTAADKQRLRQESQADAVEMESGVIRVYCRERGIAAATVRVISDDSATDLPLDFNKLSKPNGNISYGKLTAAILRSPSTIPKLKRFQSDLDMCSRKLAGTLEDLLKRISDQGSA